MKKSINAAKLNNIKILLDIVMIFIFVFLMRLSNTGVILHEIIGLSLFALFAVHNLKNYRWIAGVCKKLSKCNFKTKLMVIIDAALFVFVCIIILSGLFISQTIFNGISEEMLETWSELHHFAAYSSLVLISFHIGLHWQMLINICRRLFHIKDKNRIRVWSCRIFVLFIAVFGIRAFFNSDIQSNFTAPFISKAQSSYTTKENTEATDYSLNANGLTVDTPTLEEYLSKLFCSGCHRRCPLTNPQCGRGDEYKTQAVAQYDASYSQDNESSDSGTGDNYNNESLPVSTKENTASPLDYISMMGLITAAAYYTIKIPENTKNRI